MGEDLQARFGQTPGQVAIRATVTTRKDALMTDTALPKAIPQEIASFLDHWVGAIRAKDPTAYAACYTDDVRVFDGMNPSQYRGLDAWREMIEACFGTLGTETDLVLRDVQVQTAGDMAVVTAIVGYWSVLHGETEKRGMWGRQTNILRWTSAGWRICHEHSSVPFNGETGEADFAMRPEGDE